MTLSVVRGLINKSDQSDSPQAKPGATPVPSKPTIDAGQQVPNLVAESASLAQHAGDAVVNVLRNQNRSADLKIDKIRDPDRAQDTAEVLADKIREEDGGLEVHDGLSSSVAKEHVVG